MHFFCIALPFLNPMHQPKLGDKAAIESIFPPPAAASLPAARLGVVAAATVLVLTLAALDLILIQAAAMAET